MEMFVDLEPAILGCIGFATKTTTTTTSNAIKVRDIFYRYDGFIQNNSNFYRFKRQLTIYSEYAIGYDAARDRAKRIRLDGPDELRKMIEVSHVSIVM